MRRPSRPRRLAGAALIATFDNDGTLWAEQPVYVQMAFALDRVKALAPQPAHAPVTQYWSVTVYNRETHTLIRQAKWTSRSSQTPDLQVNADGSADIYFGPTPPAGKETNWIPTDPNGRFEVLARFYGPQKPLYDKTWRLGDIEKLDARK